MYFVKKCLGFDQMHFWHLLCKCSLFIKLSWDRSTISVPREIWSLFCPQGLGNIAVCFLFLWQNPKKNFANQIVSSKASFSLIVCVSAPVHATPCPAHVHTYTHPPALCILCLGGTRACSVEPHLPGQDAGSLWFSLWKLVSWLNSHKHISTLAERHWHHGSGDPGVREADLDLVHGSARDLGPVPSLT